MVNTKKKTVDSAVGKHVCFKQFLTDMKQISRNRSVAVSFSGIIGFLKKNPELRTNGSIVI